jgi:hypothetical protein
MALAYIRSLAFLMCEPPNRSVASHCYSRSRLSTYKVKSLEQHELKVELTQQTANTMF